MILMYKKAIKFATQQAEAQILYCVDNYVQVREVCSKIAQETEAVYRVNQSFVVFPNNSIIKVMSMERVQEYLYGAQLTHAIIDTDWCDIKIWQIIKSRVRSPVKHEGMGIYERYGKYVFGD